MREEHREKLRRAAEEAERQRQIQLAQKLEIMRQKKQVWWRAGGQAGSWAAGVLKLAGADCRPVARRSTWRCRGSWPSSACRSKRRSGSCAWSSRSRPSRCGPRCLPSPCPMPRHGSHLPHAHWLRLWRLEATLTALSLSPAPGHAHCGRRALPALWPHKFPGHLQPRRLSGRLPHAHRVHESASPCWQQPLPERARGRSR